jgi:pilus assembly protein Flp/PilA
MKSLFNRFIKDESGATAIEYGLIAALVAVAIIAALNAMTGQLNAVFGKVSGELTKAANTNTGS